MSATDEDSGSESDFDPDEILSQLQEMKELLHRHVGKHKNVARLQSGAIHWNVNPNMFEGDSLRQTIKLVNAAEDNERQRRMSIPYSGDVKATDADLEDASVHVESMHEELLHLFAVHDAKYQTECERERKTSESAKSRMQEELLMRAGRRRAREAFEEERQRKINEMEMMMTGEDEESLAMAETNEKLSEVHQDLKNAFKIMQKADEEHELEQRHAAEESKEMLLQEIRRFPSKKKQKELIEKERQERIKEYRKRINEKNEADETLVQVQEDLLKLFGKIKKDRKLHKEITYSAQEDCKALMHEELLHKTLGKQVDKQEAKERTRRIKESKSESAADDGKKQRAMDTLIDVQKQLLDVMSHVQMSSAKQQIEHLKFMNVRSNMLHEIRMRKSDHNIEFDTPSQSTVTRPGRRLSIIGEQFHGHGNSKPT